jgi:hypothetical protein
MQAIAFPASHQNRRGSFPRHASFLAVAVKPQIITPPAIRQAPNAQDIHPQEDGKFRVTAPSPPHMPDA